MHRAAAIATLGFATWSLVGCQILARQSETPGVANVVSQTGAQQATPRNTQVDDEHDAPWSVAWVRRGGPDLFVDDARGVVVSGGNLYDTREGLFRGTVRPDLLATLPNGRGIGFDEAGKLVLDRGEASADPDAPRDAVGHVVASRLLANGSSFATVEVEWQESQATAKLIVRNTEDLERTLEIPLPGNWHSPERSQLVQAPDGRLLVSLPDESAMTPRVVAADVDGSLTEVEIPFEGAFVAMSADGKTIAIAADGGIEIRDLVSGRLLHRIDDARPQAATFANDGTALAFVTTPKTGDPRVEIWRASPRRQGWVRTFEDRTDLSGPALAFADDDETLWIAADDIVAVRPGGHRQRSPIEYGAALPPEFEAVDFDGGDPDAHLAQLVYQQRDDQGATVWITAHDRRAYAPIGDDLGTWSDAVLASIGGVPADVSAPEAWSKEAFVQPDGGRVAEAIVPACEIGMSNGDLYLHVQEVGTQLIEVAIMTPAGTEPERVRDLMHTFVDEPLAKGSIPSRALPKLPARDCGI